MHDETEEFRRERVASINAEPGSREALEATYEVVYNTEELTKNFTVLFFMAPYVIVKRKSDGAQGSLEFQHSPRFYYNFIPEEEGTI